MFTREQINAADDSARQQMLDSNAFQLEKEIRQVAKEAGQLLNRAESFIPGTQAHQDRLFLESLATKKFNRKLSRSMRSLVRAFAS